MNKKLILAGTVIIAGFVTLTAFGGKTLEQQKQEIAAAITTQLDEFRAEMQEACTLRVNEEGQRRYDEYLATLPAKPAASSGKPGTRKPTSKPTSKSPLPQTVPTDPTKTRGGAVQEGNVEEAKKRGGAVPVGTDPVKNAEEAKKRPGAVKQGGGN